MDFTINCTRVPALAFSGPASNHDTKTSVLNDGATLNLPDDGISLMGGRVLPDGGGAGPTKLTSSRIIRCKKRTIISSLNTRTLGPLGRLEELAESTKRQNIDIVAIQEHRFYHPNDALEYRQAGSFQLVTSSATKNTINSTVGGVGFLLSEKASDNLLGIHSISPRIIVLELEGNPKTTVICVYSPHNSSSESDIEDLYTTLRTTVEQVPLHNFLVISGDLNAKLGPDNVRFTYNEETNRNGEHLIDFMKEFNLFSSNTSFMKPKGQLWTFEYPKSGRAQLDYLIFRKKWRNSVKDSRSYSRFSSVGSDHRVISATLKLSLRVSKKGVSHPMKRIDWKEVSSNS